MTGRPRLAQVAMVGVMLAGWSVPRARAETKASPPPEKPAAAQAAPSNAPPAAPEANPAPSPDPQPPAEGTPPPEGYPPGDGWQGPPPQEGYPAQYPPPGYPGYPQPYYPPGYYPPPGYPQYYPPPGYYPPPPAPEPSRFPHGHGRLLLLPYIGPHVHLGQSGDNQDPGVRLGGMLGFRASAQLSINAELTIDILHPASQPANEDVTGAEVDLALSPLFHFDAGKLELVFGPKLGIWYGEIDHKDQLGTYGASSSGLVVGANAGAFVPLGNGASLGALVSFVVRTIGTACQISYAGDHACVDNPGASSEKVLGITGAVLF